MHPLAGYTAAPDFATDLGRLCVALSRHGTHLHLLHDRTTPDLLARTIRQDRTNTAATTQQNLLAHLTA